MTLRDDAYREIFQNDPQPRWVVDGETGRILAVNRAALASAGVSEEEFLRRFERDLDPAQDGVARALYAGCDAELCLTPVWVGGRELRLARLVEKGEPVRLHELEQLLARKSAQAEVVQKELETFSYSVSHDLRAPLRHIDGFSRALLDDYGPALDHQGQEYLNRIVRAAQGMSQLIDDLQKLGRVARVEMQRQGVNLSVLAQVIALELKRTDPGRPVEFEIQEGLQPEGDPRLVRTLMENLIGNAWKFSGKNESARIQVGAVPGEKIPVYFVRDNGVGFDMAYAEKLFSVFHRLHRSDEFPGAGVGLAIAQRIVARHQGRIWAESAPGEGATFYFTLEGA